MVPELSPKCRLCGPVMAKMNTAEVKVSFLNVGTQCVLRTSQSDKRSQVTCPVTDQPSSEHKHRRRRTSKQAIVHI